MAYNELWTHNYDIYTRMVIVWNFGESPNLAVMLLDFHQIHRLKIILLRIMMVSCVKKKKDLSPLSKSANVIRLNVNPHD